jgi:hypothetical protein
MGTYKSILFFGGKIYNAFIGKLARFFHICKRLDRQHGDGVEIQYAIAPLELTSDIVAVG